MIDIKIYEIDTEILQTKFIPRGATTVKVMLFDDVKKMAEEYEKLPPLATVFKSEQDRFKRVVAGLIFVIRRRYKLDDKM